MKLILSPVGTSIIGRLGEFLTRPILIARKSNLGPFPGGVGGGIHYGEKNDTHSSEKDLDDRPLTQTITVV